MNNRQSPVPEGHATIAQRFNVGFIGSERSSPEGTAETARDPSAVPSGLNHIFLVLPNVEIETLGYCRASLRDEEQILIGLGACPQQVTARVRALLKHCERILQAKAA